MDFEWDMAKEESNAKARETSSQSAGEFNDLDDEILY